MGDCLDWGKALASKPWDELTSLSFKQCDVDRKNMTVARGRMLVRERVEGENVLISSDKPKATW